MPVRQDWGPFNLVAALPQWKQAGLLEKPRRPRRRRPARRQRFGRGGDSQAVTQQLEARPGAFIFTGNGDWPGLHSPSYEFNDEAVLYGASDLGAPGGDPDGEGVRD